MLWHYTVKRAEWLGRILRDGVLKREGETGRYHVHPRFILCPAVWFSANQTFEPTATKLRGNGSAVPTAEAMAQSARIGVDSAPDLYSWDMYKLRGPVIYNLTANR